MGDLDPESGRNATGRKKKRHYQLLSWHSVCGKWKNMKHQRNDNDRGKPEVLGGKRVQMTICPQKRPQKDWNGFKPGSPRKSPAIARQTSYCLGTEKNSIGRLKSWQKYSLSRTVNIYRSTVSLEQSTFPHLINILLTHHATWRFTAVSTTVHYLYVHNLYFHLLYQLNPLTLHNITVTSHRHVSA